MRFAMGLILLLIRLRPNTLKIIFWIVIVVYKKSKCYNADEDGIYLTTYENDIPPCEWGIACFDEAQRLRNDNDTNRRLKSAIANSYKILLIPAPIMNDIMDLYHLINFIDTDEFPDPYEYYNRYFRQENNYLELAERASKYVFRTLKSQVVDYVAIPNRLVASVTIVPTDAELELHDKVVEYANKPFKKAYPKMKSYELMLMLAGRLSSSALALSETMANLSNRIQGEEVDDWERNVINELASLAANIRKESKSQALRELLPELFKQLAAVSANKKVLIFVQSRVTMRMLNEILGKKYKTLTFDGSKSRNYDIINEFRDKAQIMIATDIANEGLNLEFCSCVINYDMSYNTLGIEQRILRCHRQNQQNDVLVVNLINQQNASDIRALELYKKRLKQFAGIFGVSDEIVGDFYDITGALEYFATNSRDRVTIRQSFEEKFAYSEKENTNKVEKTKKLLFSAFDEQISYTANLTPEYVETKRRKMNDDLWYITSTLLDGQGGIRLDHATRTIRAIDGIGASALFKKLYIRRNEYSMTDTSLPKSGRYTLTSKLALNVLDYIIQHKTATEGIIHVDNTDPCVIEFYEITVKKGANWWASTGYEFIELIGKTESGQILDNAECERILSLPCVAYTETGQKLTWQERLSYVYPTGNLQSLIDTDKYRNIAVKGAKIIEQEVLWRIRRNEHNKKSAIEKRQSQLKQEKAALQKQESQITNTHDRIKFDKKLAVIEDDLNQAESSLFMEKMRIEYEAEQEIKKNLVNKEVSVEVRRIYKIHIRSK